MCEKEEFVFFLEFVETAEMVGESGDLEGIETQDFGCCVKTFGVFAGDKMEVCF